MKEDILEQIGSDWLLSIPGTFVKTNLKYRPSDKSKNFIRNQDQIHSDIDLISINTKELDTIKVFNCKSWLDGFDFGQFYTKLSTDEGRQSKFAGKPIWKHFRELTSEKWTNAFIERLLAENPNAKQIEYCVLCVKAKNEHMVSKWIDLPVIKEVFLNKKLRLNNIRCVELKTALDEIKPAAHGVIENSDIGRTLQLLKAAKII
jgi:hypothetical protein